MYLWNGFTQLPTEALELCLVRVCIYLCISSIPQAVAQQRVTKWRYDNTSTMTADEQALTSLLQGALHTELKQYAEAEGVLSRIEDLGKVRIAGQ